MSYTNSTSHYQLPQYIGTDIPSILTDVNNAYQKIDTEIYNVAQSAAGATQDVSAISGRVTDLERDTRALNTNVTRISGDLESVKGVIPNDATDENMLVTTSELEDVSVDAKDAKLGVERIDELIPSSATVANKLATMADIVQVTINFPYVLATISGSGKTGAEVAAEIRSNLTSVTNDMAPFCIIQILFGENVVANLTFSKSLGDGEQHIWESPLSMSVAGGSVGSVSQYYFINQRPSQGGSDIATKTWHITDDTYSYVPMADASQYTFKIILPLEP